MFFNRLRHIELITNTLSGEHSSSILPCHSIRNNRNLPVALSDLYYRDRKKLGRYSKSCHIKRMEMISHSVLPDLWLEASAVVLIPEHRP
jgi:hypothetical protein